MRNFSVSAIPAQKKGAKSDTRYVVHKRTIPEAEILFNKAVTNLLSVNHWHELAGRGAVFQLMNQKGMEIFTTPKKFDYIKINLKGVPATEPGEGYEWVQIERIDYYKTSLMESAVIRARPSPSPLSDSRQIAHFFTSEATSNFSVERMGTKVTASVQGRNERPNLKASGIAAKLRNFFVGLGAMAGLNKSQWRNLVKGILRRELPNG